MPETLTLLPATSVSTTRPDLNHDDIGPNSSLERSSNKTLPLFFKVLAFLSKFESINNGLLGSKPKARIDLVDKFSGFRQSRKFQLTAVVPVTSLCAIA